MSIKKAFIIVFLFGFMVTAASSQTMEIGVNVGAAGYMGDLNQKNPLDFSGLAIGGYIKRNIDPYWAIGLHYNYGRIKDNDANSSNVDFRNRNINFSTPLHEISLQVDFNFLEYFAGGGIKNWSPYIFTGVGGVLFNPTAKYAGQKYDLKLYDTEGIDYKNYAISIPYGVGVKYRIAEKLGLFTQLGYRTANTDYIDDVGNAYPRATTNWSNTRVFLSKPSDNSQLINPGDQRGDYVKRDTYLFFHIGIAYTFTSDKCFAF